LWAYPVDGSVKLITTENALKCILKSVASLMYYTSDFKIMLL